MVRAVGDLHRPAAAAAIERALEGTRERADFQITHVAVLPRPGQLAPSATSARTGRRTASRRPAASEQALAARLTPRLELAVEATDHVALARGMQGFQVSLARALNRAANRRGTVFVDRYAIRRRTRR